jgi:transposase
MAAVVIGVDPHKASHTAVAIGAAEEPLGQLRVRACVAQAERLLGWVQARPQRTWAGRGRRRHGPPAGPAAGVGRGTGAGYPAQARCAGAAAGGEREQERPERCPVVAVAALRSAGVRQVRPDDHAAVLKVWSKHYRDLGRTRTQVACRLHAVLGELIPGGVPKAITTARTARVLKALRPDGAVETARWELAADLLDDLRRIDARIREARNKLTVAIAAAGTSLTGLSGVGPVIANPRCG